MRNFGPSNNKNETQTKQTAARVGYLWNFEQRNNLVVGPLIAATTTAVDGDGTIASDSEASSAKKLTWANLKATLKTYFIRFINRRGYTVGKYINKLHYKYNDLSKYKSISRRIGCGHLCWIFSVGWDDEAINARKCLSIKRKWTAGAIVRGYWSPVAGTLPTRIVEVGDTVRALVDTQNTQQIGQLLR